MQIPSYQIQNVLKVYSRQVSQGKILARNKTDNKTSFKDSVSISMEARHRSIIDKVTDDIVDKIVTEGSSQSSAPENKDFDAPITYAHPREAYLKDNPSQTPKEFTYTVIDKENNKTRQTLSVVDSQFVPTQTTPGNPPKKPIDPPQDGSEETNGRQIS